MSRPLPIALVQAPARGSDEPLDAFLEEMRRTMRRFPQTQLLAYPELHLEAYVGRATMHEVAEPLDGPRNQALAAAAGELGVWLVPGTVLERGPDGQVFNTAVVFSPQGELVAHYRKMFPWRPYEPYDAGDRFVVANLPGVGRLGLSICYDAWFPELARHLAWMGAEAILNLVHTTTSDRQQEVVIARATAIVNQVYVLSINSAGPIGTGRSVVVDPEGMVRLETLDAMPAVLTDVLDLERVDVVRQFGTAALNRPWQQFREGEPPLELPLYSGRIDPATWTPRGSA